MHEALRLSYIPTLRGRVVLPASKSVSNRALILSALAGQLLPLTALSDATDTLVLHRALMQQPDTSGHRQIDVQGAGTAMRFLTAYFALRGSATLIGNARMCERPIGPLVDALRQLGASITYLGREGYPPLQIDRQMLHGGQLTIDASISSQYVSALLMVAPYLQEGLDLHLQGNVSSRPYIEMTLQLMQEFGAHYEKCSERHLRIWPSAPYRMPSSFRVEPDWSAASYWYSMVALSADPKACITLPHLSLRSLQGDVSTADYFARLGVQTLEEEAQIVLRRQPTDGSPLVWDMSDHPDLVQTLVVTCAMQRRAFVLSGVESLRIKETDRLRALQQELARMGIALHVRERLTADSLPTTLLTYDPAVDDCASARVASPCIATYDDHRMAMAFAPAAYRFPGLRIAAPEVVAKSYPHFWEQLSAFTVK